MERAEWVAGDKPPVADAGKQPSHERSGAPGCPNPPIPDPSPSGSASNPERAFRRTELGLPDRPQRRCVVGDAFLEPFCPNGYAVAVGE